MKLHLQTPLLYKKIPLEEEAALKFSSDKEEFLFRYKLNPQQSINIEPETDQFIDSLELIGRAVQPQKTDKNSDTGQEPVAGHKTDSSQIVSIPQGVYLFMQERSEHPLTREEWLNLAIEQQKDGLWERNKLESTLYVRFLHEDGAYVTQVIREIGD